jgi:hypothetical protein
MTHAVWVILLVVFHVLAAVVSGLYQVVAGLIELLEFLSFIGDLVRFVTRVSGWCRRAMRRIWF